MTQKPPTLCPWLVINGKEDFPQYLFFFTYTGNTALHNPGLLEHSGVS